MKGQVIYTHSFWVMPLQTYQLFLEIASSKIFFHHFFSPSILFLYAPTVQICISLWGKEQISGLSESCRDHRRAQIMQRPCLLCFTLCDFVSAVAVDGEIGVVALAAVAAAAVASAASSAVVGLPHAMGLRT